ncbi:hypothetical protein C2G38_2169497 [Gigaspora rosea]|uniref:Uncharacterized protein n=1 Tax=Gigaspora rosea TaxID=44941 RepID=A0A397VNJ0_9GLOM|nr:hypothetical protein C2G38_2169497 [Gigaspora rosea]
MFTNVKNIPIANKELVSQQIKEAFEDIGKIVAIKPILYKEQKITTKWKSVSKIYYFCDKEGNIKKNFKPYQEFINLKKHYKEFRKESYNKIENKCTQRIIWITFSMKSLVCVPYDILRLTPHGLMRDCLNSVNIFCPEIELFKTIILIFLTSDLSQNCSDLVSILIVLIPSN